MSKSKKPQDLSFINFDISNELLRGIQKTGYIAATPIQNKVIPLILNGVNVVAMAPTGSGKTAAFLIPMLDKLICHSALGARALVISPTRELALQTLQFTKKIGRYMNLTVAVLLGGSNMEDDFKSLHENPDIIIATPARLMHLKVEMGRRLNLGNIEYVVFDEGDRLFELDLADQLTEILNNIPKSRQAVIFSATLPGKLADFVQAGISDPMLIRIDVNKKINDKLKNYLFYCSDDSKLAVVIELLQNILKRKEQVIVFMSTKYHIEYASSVLTNLSMPHVTVYNSLDKEARVINTNKFVTGKTPIMLVTDVCARGLDIPLLPNMINVDLPDKPKMFVHRVGRVARAGNVGNAYTLVSNYELPYLFDTFMFLGKPLKIVDSSPEINEELAVTLGLLGSVPTALISRQQGTIYEIAKRDPDVEKLRDISSKAFQKYTKTKLCASKESGLRAKCLSEDILEKIRSHPFFAYATGNETEMQLAFQAKLRDWNKSGKLLPDFVNKKRAGSERLIENIQRLRKMHEKQQNLKKLNGIKEKFTINESNLIMKEKKIEKTDEFYITDIRKDEQFFAQERGLKVNNSGFRAETKEAQLEFQNDEFGGELRPMGSKQQRMLWDRKRKRFVGPSESVKKIRTESGVMIPASYKTDKYEKWAKQTNNQVIGAKSYDQEDMEGNDDGDEDFPSTNEKRKIKKPKKNENTFKVLNTLNRYKNSNNTGKKSTSNGRNELKPEQIQKKMREKEDKKKFQKGRQIRNRGNSAK